MHGLSPEPRSPLTLLVKKKKENRINPMDYSYDLFPCDYPGNLNREVGREWYDGQRQIWVNLGAMS